MNRIEGLEQVVRYWHALGVAKGESFDVEKQAKDELQAELLKLAKGDQAKLVELAKYTEHIFKDIVAAFRKAAPENTPILFTDTIFD